MKIVQSIFAGIGRRRLPMLLSLLVMAGASSAYAQGFYDDDLYYDASKAKKEQSSKKDKKKQGSGATQTPATDPSDTNHLYYYDGATYVPWENVGDFRAAGSYIPEGGSDRDVDEYNRHGATYAQPSDSISLEQFEDYSADMAATREMARFGGSTVAAAALEDEGYDLSFNNGYNEGYAAGYNNGLYNGDNTSVVVTFGTGYLPWWLYPYGYGGLYDTWGWPYDGWRYVRYNPYYYGWTPMWGWGWNYGWSWGWSTPSWAWGGCYPGGWHNHGWGGWHGNFRPSSPSAAHRPRTGSHYDSSRGGSTSGHATGGSRYGSGSSRPGYHPPVDGRVNSGSSSSGNRSGYNYGGSSSGRNSHYGGSSSGSSRSSGYSSGSHSSGSRSGGYSSGSSSSGRSSGSHSSGSRGGSSSGGGRSSGGGGGHRGR